MLYLICSALSSEGISEYLIFDSDAKKISAYDHDSAAALIMGHRVENAKLENMVIKAADCPDPKRLGYAERNRNSVYYVYDLRDDILKAVSNTGEIFIMSMNVALDFFRSKKLLNAAIKGDRLIVQSGRKFISPLRRDYSHAQTK